jgi:hypothetical protein
MLLGSIVIYHLGLLLSAYYGSFLFQSLCFIEYNTAPPWAPFCLIFLLNILWHNRPMREVITFRNFKERDCATVAECYHVLPPLPFPRFASLRVLLGYAVISWLRKDDVTSVTSCATIHNTAFLTCQIPMLIGETEGSSSSSSMSMTSSMTSQYD